MSVATVAAIAAVGSIGMSAYESSQQGKISGQALGLAQNQQQEQQYYNQQLQQLMANPSSFLKSPIFQGSLNQGLQGVSRQMASQGYLGSGNEATALEQYGQNASLGALFNQENILSGDAGLGFNPAGALGTASGAQSASSNELSGMLGPLGFYSYMNQNQPGGGGGGGGWWGSQGSAGTGGGGDVTGYADMWTLGGGTIHA